MTDELIDLNKERKLNQAIEQLAEQDSPSHDLWPEIKNKIERINVAPTLDKAVSNEPFKITQWIPIAVAASLTISIISIAFTWISLERSDNYHSYNEVEASEKQKLLAASHHPLIKQVAFMESEYQTAKLDLMKNISLTSSNFEVNIANKVENELVDIKKARELLKNELSKNPNNSYLAYLLQTTYQQEMKILSQVAKLSTSI